MVNFYPTFRGPQEAAQANAQSLPTPNNGNPNGANNNSGDSGGGIDPMAQLALPAHTRRNSDLYNMSTGPVNVGQQHENLGRYAPPTVDAQGRNTQRGPYSYNLPNAYGGTESMTGMPNWRTYQTSNFAPEFANNLITGRSRFGYDPGNQESGWSNILRRMAGRGRNFGQRNPALENAAMELERMMEQQQAPPANKPPSANAYTKPIVIPEYSDNTLPLPGPGEI